MLTEEMARLVALLPSEMSAMGEAILNGPIEASRVSTPFRVSQELSHNRTFVTVTKARLEDFVLVEE